MLDLKTEESLRAAMTEVTELGRKMLHDLESVSPMVFVFKGDKCRVHMLNFKSPELKNMSMLVVREKMKSEGPDMAVFVSEAWMVQTPIEQKRSLLGANLAEHPDRVEVVTIIGAADECRLVAAWRIDRGEDGRAKVGEDIDTGMTGAVQAVVFDDVFKPAAKPGHC